MLPRKRKSEAPPDVTCQTCGKAFHNLSELGAHNFLVHGRKSECRRWVPATNACEACMQWFCSREVAVEHLQKSVRCFNAVRNIVSPLDTTEFEILEKESTKHSAWLATQGYRRTKVTSPTIKLYGPLRLASFYAGICPTHRLTTRNCRCFTDVG